MTINDSNWKFLHDATGLSLTFNDMYYRYLRDQGFFGTLQDMIAKSGLGMNPSGLKNPANAGVGDWFSADFITGEYVIRDQSKTLADVLTLTRASAGNADNLAGVWSSYATDVARLNDKGLRYEAATTNEIENNSGQGASGATPPTTWVKTNGPGLTITYGTGTLNGIDYTTIRAAGTASGAQGLQIAFGGTSQVAALTGETWTNSAFIALAAGSLANIGAIHLDLTERTAAAAFVKLTNSADIKGSLSAALQRFVHTSALSGGATTAFVQPRISMDIANGLAVDITIWVGWPQLEKAAIATAPIRTTTADGVRAADVGILHLPPGTFDLTITFDDMTTQIVSGASGDFPLAPPSKTVMRGIIARPFLA